jgi:hypothetical protein
VLSGVVTACAILTGLLLETSVAGVERAVAYCDSGERMVDAVAGVGRVGESGVGGAELSTRTFARFVGLREDLRGGGTTTPNGALKVRELARRKLSTDLDVCSDRS